MKFSDARLLPPHILKLVDKNDLKGLFIVSQEEQMRKMTAKSERDLQRQIVQYLRLRGIEVIHQRMDKRTTTRRGLPDIMFSVMSNGFPAAIAYEIKWGSGTLTREQNDMLERLKTRPNAWRVRVITSFIQVVDDMRELGL